MYINELVPDAQLESKNIEYKGIIEEGTKGRERSRESGWLRTLVAFANCEGGCLYVGVEDKTHKILALDAATADRVVLMVHRLVRERIAPLIRYDISSISVPDTDPPRYVLRISVEPCKEPPVFLHEDGFQGIYIRSFGRTDMATPEQIRDLVLYGDSAVYDSILTYEEYRPGDYTTLLHAAEEHGRTYTDKQLVSAGFMSQDGRLSRGALLFRDDYSGTATYTVATWWPGATKGSDEVLAYEEYRGNLLDIIRQSAAFVAGHSANGYRKEATYHRDYVAYPPRSVTEGLVNAVGHRNYFIQGTQIEVNIYRDRLELVSPGSLLGVSELNKEKNIRNIMPRRRNEVICATLELCGYMEKKGSGFDKISDDYDTYGDRFAPYISCNASSFTLTLPDVTHQAGIVADLEEVPDIYINAIARGKYDMEILSYCYNYSRTAAEIAQHIGIKPSTYFRHNSLEPLLSSGYLLAIRDGRACRYRSNPEQVKLM